VVYYQEVLEYEVTTTEEEHPTALYIFNIIEAIGIKGNAGLVEVPDTMI